MHFEIDRKSIDHTTSFVRSAETSLAKTICVQRPIVEFQANSEAGKQGKLKFEEIFRNLKHISAASF